MFNSLSRQGSWLRRRHHPFSQSPPEWPWLIKWALPKLTRVKWLVLCLRCLLTTLATRDSRMNNNTTTGYRCSNHEHNSCLIISKSSIKQVAIAIAAELAAYIMQVIFIIVTQGKCQSLKKRSLQVIEWVLCDPPMAWWSMSQIQRNIVGKFALRCKGVQLRLIASNDLHSNYEYSLSKLH